MPCRDTLQTYGCGTRFLHALISVLIIFQLLLGLCMGYMSKSWANVAYTLHKSTGIVILFVAIIFVLWRWMNPRPSWPDSMKRWERYSAHAVHTMLYWLLILMPLTGWAMSTAAGHPPNFFWLFQFSMPLIPHDKALASACSWLHVIFAWWITALLVVHVLAALKHHFIDKDNILKRIFCSKP